MKYLKIRSKFVINSKLVCTSPGKKCCYTMHVSLLLAQSLFLSHLIFTNLTSPRNSSQIIKRESLWEDPWNVPLAGKREEAFLCSARTLLTKIEVEEAGATENSLVLSSLHETLETKTRRVQQSPFPLCSSLKHSCIQQKPDRVHLDCPVMCMKPLQIEPPV